MKGTEPLLQGWPIPMAAPDHIDQPMGKSHNGKASYGLPSTVRINVTGNEMILTSHEMPCTTNDSPL